MLDKIESDDPDDFVIGVVYLPKQLFYFRPSSNCYYLACDRANCIELWRNSPKNVYKNNNNQASDN
ncbi:MAG: hypothetical protein Q7R99_03695 [bacterium]|nr:hypothetical protein [bacterium]